ncbi:hypothetical protein [Noviherbaspirillum sedimenti]|nr:hypothetical protein [Noviherbaspirillum sedimenti]
MGTRFGRRTADGTIEYHDNKDSLVVPERRDRSAVKCDIDQLAQAELA